MARDEQHWNREQSGRFDQTPERNERSDRHRDREYARGMGERNPQQGFSRPREWSDRNADRGEAEGAWDEGQPGGRGYGQGMYDQRPGSQGQEGYGAGSGEWGQRGWGQYSRESNHGRDLGEARNSYGDTGGDRYGGGESRGGFGGIGNHVGRGPRGWKRSDERIREDVNEQLERHPQIDATDIEVRVEEGEVILSGTVDDRRMKRMAEDVVENIAGVREVQNHIRVQSGQRSGGATGMTGGSMSGRPSGGTASNQADGQTTSGSGSGSTGRGNR